MDRQTGIIALNGKPGTGKTALLVVISPDFFTINVMDIFKMLTLTNYLLLFTDHKHSCTFFFIWPLMTFRDVNLHQYLQYINDFYVSQRDSALFHDWFIFSVVSGPQLH